MGKAKHLPGRSMSNATSGQAAPSVINQGCLEMYRPLSPFHFPYLVCQHWIKPHMQILTPPSLLWARPFPLQFTEQSLARRDAGEWPQSQAGSWQRNSAVPERSYWRRDLVPTEFPGIAGRSSAWRVHIHRPWTTTTAQNTHIDITRPPLTATSPTNPTRHHHSIFGAADAVGGSWRH